MIKSLKQVNADKIIVKSRDSLAVNTTLFDCDYYMALAGDVASNKFLYRRIYDAVFMGRIYNRNACKQI